ncbi:MAG: hypothetical protein KIS94_13620 [Chitinophagales bacterium]|nr:hypothetical protein [Chitinophagales bacterium]
MDFIPYQQLTNAKEEEIRRLKAANNPDVLSLKEFHSKLLEQAEKDGEADGKLNKPSANDDTRGYEKEIEGAYTGKYNELMLQEQGSMQTLRDEFNALLRYFTGTPEGIIRKRIYEYEQQFENARIEASRAVPQTDGNGYFLKHTWLIYLIVGLLGVLELPLNNTVFKAFKIGRGDTALVALLLVIIIPISAHFTGLFLKRWNGKTHNKIWSIILATLLVSFAVAMSLFRYVYFESINLQGTYLNLAEAFKHVKVAGAFSHPEFWVVLFFNILLILIGIILGFNAHDSDSNFETAYKNFHFKRANDFVELESIRRAKKKEADLKGKTILEEEQYNHYLKLLSRQHNELHDFIKRFGQTVNENYIQTISKYKGANQNNRTDPDPAYWHNGIEPIIDLPVEDEKIQFLY